MTLFLLSLSLLFPAVYCPAPSAPVARCVTADIEYGNFAPCYEFGADIAPLSTVYWGGAPEPTAFTWLTQQRATLVTAVVVDDGRARSMTPWAETWTFYEEAAPWGAETITWCGVDGYATWLPGVGR